ncbi:organic cation/carnitine transporter 2-like [Babylonia areolata]|uniref:organic cation/carnitine transporter 2-like n=1 Tax=Babylonia areolata TaxID=304850 RepID=UPI003FD2418E
MDKNLESLVEEVGSFGCFQYLLIPLSFSSVFVAVWTVMFMAFGAIQPEWRCASRGSLANQSLHSILNYSLGLDNVTDGNTTLTSAKHPGDVLDVNTTDGLEANACDAFAANDEACEHIVFAPGMSTIVTEFQLVCDLSWVPSLTISMQMVGVVIGATLAGQLADSVGRKKTMVSFTSLHAVFNLIAAFSVNWQMFAVLRLLTGLTAGGLEMIGISFPTEFIGRDRRAVVSSVPYWGVGAVTLSLLVWAVPHWSHVHLITAACSAICLVGWLFLPESVRWLAVKGHVTEAQRVLCKMARWNGRNPPNLSSVQALCSDSGHTQRKYNIFHIFSTCEMMKVTCLAGFMWFVSSITYYGILFGIKNLSGDFNLNFFVMTAVEIPPPLLVFHLSRRFGRRWTLFGIFSICTLSVVAVVPLSLLLSEEEAGSYINALCIVCRGGLILGWNTMCLYLAELYPTVVRNIGLGFCSTFARLGGILAPYILSEKKLYISFSIISGAMALSATAPLFLMETRGQPLQDELIIPSNQKTAATADAICMNGVQTNGINDEKTV